MVTQTMTSNDHQLSTPGKLKNVVINETKTTIIVGCRDKPEKLNKDLKSTLPESTVEEWKETSLSKSTTGFCTTFFLLISS